MTLEHLELSAPILSMAIFFLTDRVLLNRPTRWSKVAPTTVIQIINIAVSFGLSFLLLVPLVFLLVPLQFFSFSEWQVPIWVSFIASFLFLDLVHYISHRLHHAIPVLWRLHRLHHSDRDVDVFTTVLHHPLEVVTGFFWVVVCAVIFDVPVIVLTTFSIVSGFLSAFTHLNSELPEKFDRYFKWIIVTPNFHRLHHSLDMREGNSNFGEIFIFWDYIFKTNSSASHLDATVFGISKDQAPKQDSIGAYLTNPLR